MPFQNGCTCNIVAIELRVVQFLVWNHTCDFKSNSRCKLVQFWNHTYNFWPNCTPLSSITIIKPIQFFTLQWAQRGQTSFVCNTARLSWYCHAKHTCAVRSPCSLGLVYVFIHIKFLPNDMYILVFPIGLNRTLMA